MAEERGITIGALKPFSAGRVCGALGALFGALMALFSFFGFSLSAFSFIPFVVTGDFLTIFVLALGLAVIGFFAGVAIAFAYNMIADLMGGIEVETDSG